MHRRWRKDKQPSIEVCTFETKLQSEEPDLLLDACLEVRWQRMPTLNSHHDPEAAIRDYARIRAEEISSKEPVTLYYAVQDRINSVFGMPYDLHDSAIRILWGSTRITVGSEQLTEALQRQRTRNNARLREEQQEDEIRHVDAFRSQVLADPGMALAYWFMKDPSTVGKASSGEIEKLSNTIASYDPEASWVQISQVIRDFVRDLTSEERSQSIDVLRKWFHRYGMPEYANRLPREFRDAAPDVSND